MKLEQPKLGRFGTSIEGLIQVLDQFFTGLTRISNSSSHAGLIAVWPDVTVATPEGWLICDNAEYNQTKYEDLYEKIKQTYGGGTGTFRVPGGAHLPILPSANMIWIIRV